MPLIQETRAVFRENFGVHYRNDPKSGLYLSSGLAESIRNPDNSGQGGPLHPAHAGGRKTCSPLFPFWPHCSRRLSSRFYVARHMHRWANRTLFAKYGSLKPTGGRRQKPRDSTVRRYRYKIVAAPLFAALSGSYGCKLCGTWRTCRSPMKRVIRAATSPDAIAKASRLLPRAENSHNVLL